MYKSLNTFFNTMIFVIFVLMILAGLNLAGFF